MDTGKTRDDITYKVTPNIKNSLFVFLGYLIIVAGLQKLSGVAYTDVTQTSENMLKFIIFPVLIATIYITIFAIWSGWWKDLFKDKFKIQGHKWMYLLIVFAVIGTIGNIATGTISEKTTSFILYAAIATALVGYSEELMTRGLLLRGARGSGLSEVKVFLLTSLMFGLMHALNIINGQDLKTTMVQVLLTGLSGGIYYAIFRKTGLLWVTMFLHAAWDFALLTGTSELNQTSTASDAAGLLGIFVYGSYIVLFASIHLFNVKNKKKTENTNAA
jgi:membrane protease YdiL (CAAX protease family)